MTLVVKTLPFLMYLTLTLSPGRFVDKYPDISENLLIFILSISVIISFLVIPASSAPRLGSTPFT